MRRVKKRGLPYTYQEKYTLLTIIKKYKSCVVDDKRTTSVVAARKKRIWATIADEFNSQTASDRARDPKQLKHLFLNLKTRFKINPEPEETSPEDGLFAKFYHEAMLELSDSNKSTVNNEEQHSDEYSIIVDIHPLDIVSENNCNSSAQKTDGGNTLNVAVKEEGMNEYDDPLDNDNPGSDSDLSSESDECDEAETSLDLQDPVEDEKKPSKPIIKRNVTTNNQAYFNKAKQNIMQLRETYFKIKISNARLQRMYMEKKSELELKILQEKLLQLKKSGGEQKLHKDVSVG